MSEIKNGKLSLHGAEHSQCNRMVTLGFKGLKVYGQDLISKSGTVMIRFV